MPKVRLSELGMIDELHYMLMIPQNSNIYYNYGARQLEFASQQTLLPRLVKYLPLSDDADIWCLQWSSPYRDSKDGLRSGGAAYVRA
jgi:hypothetical protein